LPLLHLRKCNGVSPALRIADELSDFRVQLPADRDGFAAEIVIPSQGDSLQAYGTATVEQPLDPEESDLSEIVSPYISRLGVVNQRVLELILQELRVRDHHILTAGRQEWSDDGEHWHEFPYDIYVTAVSCHTLFELDKDWRPHLQAVIEHREEALVALQHLREAWQRRSYRSSWIEATLAAELAIKEVLVRLEPKLGAVLFDLPTPPLHTLYGVVLERVAGERSPYVKELHAGATTRNRLVHRPERVRLDGQEVVGYFEVVQRAIWHLIKLSRRRAVEAGESRYHWVTAHDV